MHSLPEQVVFFKDTQRVIRLIILLFSLQLHLHPDSKV